MIKKVLVNKTASEMEVLGYKWGKITLPTSQKNTVLELECWHNDACYVQFKESNTKKDELIKIIEENGGLDINYIKSCIRADGYAVSDGNLHKYITNAIKGFGYDRVASRAAWYFV